MELNIYAIDLVLFEAPYVNYICPMMCFVDFCADRAYVYQQILSLDWIETSCIRSEPINQFQSFRNRSALWRMYS